MHMPVHIFMSLCNVLANQFKEEAEKQKEEQENTMADMPNLRQFSDIGDISSSFSLPNFNFPS